MESPAVPDHVRVRLGHGYVQRLAEGSGIDLLHIKGPAIDPRLTPLEADGSFQVRASFDVDVLARPTDADRLVSVLMDAGWHRVSGFRSGSAFGHATSLRHSHLGLLDVHRHWPGFTVEPERAFEMLWSDRAAREIAQVRCAVPSVDHQRLLILTHAARSGGARVADVQVAWTEAGPEAQERVRQDAELLGARVALAAANGELAAYRNDPDHRLWAHFSAGSTSRLDEWRGRWSAARGVRRKLSVAGDFIRVNPDLLRDGVDHEPTAADWMSAYRRRLGRAARDAVRQGRARCRR